MEEQLRKPEAVADYIGKTVGALAQMRHRGNGPKFVKLGKAIRYRDSDITEWLEQNTRQQT